MPKGPRWIKMASSWHHLPGIKPWKGELELCWCRCLGVMVGVGFTGQAGSGLLVGKNMVSGSFIHHLWVAFTGNSISQTRSSVSMKFFFRVRSM